MPDIISVATLVTLLIGISVALWKFWRWNLGNNVGKAMQRKNVTIGMVALSKALEEHGKDIEALKALSHMDDMRHTELKSAVAQIASQVQEADQDLKNIISIMLKKGI